MTWQRTEVAPDGTHHQLEGAPLYSERFDAVLPFHAPGLAPVRRGAEAWHVDPQGRPAYPARFRQTFGFYEERAAVDDGDGWFHALADGRALYDSRYAWCGNFQRGMCPVRQRDSRYLHIDLVGQAAYAARWRYAGDFREGAAVVQGDDGRSTHIDRRGELIHGWWFDDLDVFHKGLARARGDSGWFHVDRLGRAAYEQRFAAIEPFYNGQARVERIDGTREIIGVVGSRVLLLRPR